MKEYDVVAHLKSHIKITAGTPEEAREQYLHYVYLSPTIELIKVEVRES